MSDKPQSSMIPNSFQTPNVYIDVLFPLLDNEEKALLIFACRRIFGWQKRTDRISASQFATGCGMHMDTVTSRLKSLEKYRILLRVSENDARANEGIEWALQLDDTKVDWQGLEARKAEKDANYAQRTQAARAKATARTTTTPPAVSTPPLSDSPTPTPVGQGTQNPIKPIKTFSADAQKIKPQVPASWGLAWQVAAGANEITLPTAEEQAAAQMADAVNLFHPGEQPYVQIFILATGIFPIKADVAFWRKSIAYFTSKGISPAALELAAKQAHKDGMTISNPNSLLKYAVAAQAKATQLAARASQKATEAQSGTASGIAAFVRDDGTLAPAAPRPPRNDLTRQPAVG